MTDKKNRKQIDKRKDETLGTCLEEGCCFFCKIYLQKFTHHPEMEVLWGFSVFKRLRLEKGWAA